MRTINPRENTSIIAPARHTCTSYSIVEFVCNMTIWNSVPGALHSVRDHVLYNNCFCGYFKCNDNLNVMCEHVITITLLGITCTARRVGTAMSRRESRRATSDVERKSVKEGDVHFTARGQRARYTIADCAPIAVCGSRPAFVDPSGTLSGARARPQCFHAPPRWGYYSESWENLPLYMGGQRFKLSTQIKHARTYERYWNQKYAFTEISYKLLTVRLMRIKLISFKIRVPSYTRMCIHRFNNSQYIKSSLYLNTFNLYCVSWKAITDLY